MSKYLDVDEEIELLESVLQDIESAIETIKESPYHSHLADSWETDKEEINERLDELYEEQNDQWEEEQEGLKNEYWGNVL